MELINDFFVSYTVQEVPKIIHLKNTMIGKIFFYPTKRNIFVRDFSLVFLFDDKDISLSEGLIQFITYTGIHKEEFDRLCWSIWDEELSSASPSIY